MPAGYPAILHRIARHRRNHTVQRGYLNLFARDERIVCHLVDSGETKEIGTRDAAVRKNYYVTEFRDGTRSTALEEAIGRLETPVPGILRRIERDWPLDEDSRATLADYLALQAVRTPAWDQSYRSMTESWLREKRSSYDCTDEQWASLRSHVAGDAHRHESLVANQNKLTTLLGSMHWTLLTFSHPRLITSDHPLVVVSADPDAPPGAIPPGGMANAIEFIFPVGPRRALLLTWIDGPDEERSRHCSARHASVINAHLLANAQRQWFTAPGTTMVSPMEGRVQPMSRILYGGRYTPRVAVDSDRRKRVLAIIGDWIESDEERSEVPIIRALPDAPSAPRRHPSNQTRR